MRNLTLGDLSLGLANLLTDRKTFVDGCTAGQLFGPMLIKKRTAIEGLPEALRGGKPLAEELAQIDDDYDGFGGGIHVYTEAILLIPTTTAVQHAAAQRIREAFIPSRARLTDSYAEEAAAAKINRAKLAERKNDLDMFPIPGNKTLYEWAVAFVDCGDKLDDLLNQRSMAAIGGATRLMAARLRSETLGILYQFRSAVAAEVSDKNLSPDLEAQIFSYLDELSARRPSKKTPAKTDEEPPPAQNP